MGWDEDDGPQVEWPQAAAGVGLLLAVRGLGTPQQGGFGWSGDDGDPTSFSAAVQQEQDGIGASVDVGASGLPDDMSDEFHVWHLLTTWFHQVVSPGPGLVFPLDLHVDRWQADVDVEGEVVPFVVVGEAERWVASGRVDGREVTVVGTGLRTDGLALVRVRPEDVAAPVFPEPEEQ